MKITRQASGGLGVILLACVGFVFSCAKMGRPPGGPEDKRGPQVVKTFPTGDTTEVSRKLEATIRFDEAVNRRAVESALFLSPDPGERLRLFWRGNELHIRYLDSLAQNRTYVITIGSSARDIRGNPTDRPFTLAFSTGNRIDRGRIWGQVGGEERPQGVNLWAYALSDSILPNPQIESPVYRTQPDASGTFRFSYLQSDTYRVFAVMDVGMDGFWNPSVDRIGIPPRDVVVTDEFLPYLSFRLGLQDTASASVRGVISKNERQLEVRLSKPLLDSVSFVLENFSGNTAGIDAAYENPEDSTSWQLFGTRPLEKGKWKLKTTIIKRSDQSQQTFIDTVRVLGTPDTTRPEIVKQFPQPRQRLVDPPAAMEFFFSEALRFSDSIAWFKLSSLKPADTLLLSPHWFHAAHLSLELPKILQRGKNYTLEFNASAFSDLSGNLLGDTARSFNFQVLSDDSLGSLSGTLNDTVESSHVISAWSLQAKQVVRVVGGVLPGEFLIEGLPAGPYLLEVLRDNDDSGDYFAGTMNPLCFSEPFWTPRDTFMVRSRWDRGGIQLNFPISK